MSLESRFTSKLYWWPERRKLIYVFEEATSDYWDGQWLAMDKGDLRRRIMRGRRARGMWFRTLKRYLPDTNSKILEAGCGDGHLVDAMQHWGYQAVGVDYAASTVEKIKEVMPNLDVRHGDVRSLEFEDAVFDGYFSLGVIEHFWEGYDAIVAEMQRVLKPGGYLFLTVPCISRLDRLKIVLRRYKKLQQETAPNNFYQFALDVQIVQHDFEVAGFECVAVRRFTGLAGLARVFPVFRRAYSALLSKNKVVGLFSSVMDRLLAPLSGDMTLFVMKKMEKANE